MDPWGCREVFIPRDAQVGSVPIPDWVLRRMGVPGPPNTTASSLSPEGTWISPVFLRKRTREADPGGEPFRSVRRTPAAAQHRQVDLPFVTSNGPVLDALREYLPSTHRANTTRGRGSPRRLPRVASRPLDQDTVVIYKKTVFLIPSTSRKGGDPPRTPPSPPPQALSSHTDPDSPATPSREPQPSPITYPGKLEVPEDSVVAHRDGQEEPEDVPSALSMAPNAENTAATGSPLSGVQDRGSPLSGVQDRGSPLSGVQDRGSPLSGVQDRGSTLLGVQDCGSPLSGVQDRGSPLSGVQDRGSPLSGVQDCGSPGVQGRGGRRCAPGLPCRGSRPRTTLKHIDFEALAREERIAWMRAKLRESEEALSSVSS